MSLLQEMSQAGIALNIDPSGRLVTALELPGGAAGPPTLSFLISETVAPATLSATGAFLVAMLLQPRQI